LCGLNWNALKEALVESDLGDIVDVKFHPLEFTPQIIPTHPEKCPTLAKTETNCNYIADGANLCAQHSAQWFQFTDCMFQLTLQGDSENPLANETLFDPNLRKCAEVMSDYSVEDLRACTYGEEAEQIRAENMQTISEIFSQLGLTHPNLVWASVGGKLVSNPSETDSPVSDRAVWQKKLVDEVCAQYSGPKLLPSCSSLQV